MKRFYGSAEFEGEEVADSAFRKLQDIRAEEQRAVEASEAEFQSSHRKLIAQRDNEIAHIHSEAFYQISLQNRTIAYSYNQISRIRAELAHAITDIKYSSFLKFHVHNTKEEMAETARFTSEAHRKITELEFIISQCYHNIAQIKADSNYAIQTAHATFSNGFNIIYIKRETDITQTHEDATNEIASVIALRYYLPVFMLRCAKGPCEFCRAKYGTTGTFDELEKLACVPPFHDDCRCWHEEVGYVVMTR